MRRVLALSPLLAAAWLGPGAEATISYTLTPVVSARTFNVSMEVPAAGTRPIFRLPTWSPGFYFLLPYAKNVSGVRATTKEGAELVVRRDGSAWTVENPTGGDVRFAYRVLGDDRGLGFFGAHLREGAGFVNGASTWMYVDGRKQEDTRLRLRLPDGWDEATAMNKEGDAYVAGGFDELVDSPVQMGRFQRRKFEVQGIPFEAIWVAPENAPRANLNAETERLRRASIPALKLFGRASFKRYIYFVHLEVGDFAGGLEHRASNVIAVSNADQVRLDDLATHEFFHAWNVKQIRPSVLGPFDYTQKVRTGNLWFSEGVTEYYAKITAYRAGLRDRGWLLEAMTNLAQETARSKIEKTIPVEEASRRAWENGGFGVGDFSYYTKGALIGLLLDAQLRGASGGKKSLDDLMRRLYNEHELPKPGFEEDELRKEYVEMGGDGTLYDTLVRAKGQTPLASLKMIGLRATSPNEPYLTPLYQTDTENVVTAVAADSATIRKGDRVLSLERPNGSELRTTAVVLRNGKRIAVRVALLRSSVADVRIVPDPFADELARARLAEWLRPDLDPAPSDGTGVGDERGARRR